MNLQRGRGVGLLAGKWIEWILPPLRAQMLDGRYVIVNPGDKVLLGLDEKGQYTHYLWHQQKTVH